MGEKGGGGLYLNRGVKAITTESSLLVSSSKYLNSSRLRDWCSVQLLRRNGPDRPIPSDNVPLVGALNRLRDEDHIEALFERDRQTRALLDAWLSERFMSTFELEDLRDLPADSIGRRLHDFVVSANAQLDIVPRATPTNHFDFYTRRHLQTHDFEHLMSGGLFDAVGETVPFWMNLSNMFKHLSPELAGELNVKYIFGAMRLISRAILHYPQAWPAMLECILQGIKVGLASEAIFMFKYEDVLHLNAEDARKALGVGEAYDVDTREASEIFTEMVRAADV
jgi:ubiquinone biosynthesis protein COQ4